MRLLKTKPVRSKHLRESARGQDCTLRLPGCDGGGETTVLAHLPFSGTGMGTKATDTAAVYACYSCHQQLDGHAPLQVDYETLLEQCLRAHAETQQRQVEAGIISVKGYAA